MGLSPMVGSNKKLRMKTSLVDIRHRLILVLGYYRWENVPEYIQLKFNRELSALEFNEIKARLVGVEYINNLIINGNVENYDSLVSAGRTCVAQLTHILEIPRKHDIFLCDNLWHGNRFK
jgi:hypothetical protein